MPLCTAPKKQWFPFVLKDGGGGAFIAWPDQRDSASNGFDVYAQRLDASGVPQWTQNGMPVCTFPGDQANPHMASDGAGGVIIAWQDLRSWTNFDIYAQRLGPSGVPLWTAGGVRLRKAQKDQWLSHSDQPSIVADGRGGAIATWEEWVTGFNTDIRAQRVDSSGVVQWTQYGIAVSTASSFQSYPTLVGDEAGGAIITWEDWRLWPVAHTYAQRVNGAGQGQWAVGGILVSDSTNDQRAPTLVSDERGGAIIAYTQWNGSDGDVFAQRVNAAGQLQWPANGVGVCTLSCNQIDPVIASDGAGGAILVWDDDRVNCSGCCTDLYAQRLDAGGMATWVPQGVAVCTSWRVQSQPAVVGDGSGGAIVAWTDQRALTEPSDIYAQHLNALGIPQWALDGVNVTNASSGQGETSIASDEAGGAIIAWDDGRNSPCDEEDCLSNPDIFATRLGGGGPLSVPSQPPRRLPSLTLRPNPMRSVATVAFEMPTTEPVTVEIYDLAGHRVRTLARSHEYPAGTQTLVWNGRSDAGLLVASGVYLLRLSTAGYSQSRRIVLLR